MITIRHNHEEGTILHGSSKGDGVWEIVRQPQHGGFRFSRHVGIHLRGSRDRDADQWRIDAATKALRDAGHEVTIEIDNTWRAAAEREADRQARVNARVDRLTDRAAAAATRSEAAREGARRIADSIPFGQPILVGHHSQRRAERDAERIHQGMRKSVEEHRYAQRLTDRAHAAAAHEAHKHDPRAMTRRIERLDAEMRRWQRSGRSRADREVERLTEEINHLRGKLAALEASGEYVAWGPEHFRKGDQVRARESWHTVRRVNTKSVSVPWIVGSMHTGEESKHSDRIPWDEVTGRRRDGWQLDTPNGEPWPVEQAKKVARWRQLLACARLEPRRYEPETQHVQWARRLVHGLEPTAGTPEVAAYEEQVTKVDDKRRLAIACLEVFDRLQAGELVPDITASLAPFGVEPTWMLPDDGEPQDRRVDQITAGDLVAGIWDRGPGSRLLREFAGPVKHVSPVVDRRENGQRVTITLADGSSRELQTHRWLAVFPTVRTPSPTPGGAA